MYKLINKPVTAKLLLIIIVMLAFGLRRYGSNWDLGYHFHPDERMLIMKTLDVRWVNPITRWDDFISPDSKMNPNFFAYGSLPMYLLGFMGWLAAIVSSDEKMFSYDGLLVVGRLLSAMVDSITVLLVYLLARIKLNKKWALTASLIYSLAVFPIQSGRFFTVDSYLTMWIVGYLWMVAKWRVEKENKFLLIAAVFWGLALATKFSALIAGGVVGILAIVDVVTFIRKSDGKKLLYLSKDGILFGLIAIVVLTITQPYMWIDWNNFLNSMKEQTRMRIDPWTFPYTRQYVGTLPYIYHLEQLIRWGYGWWPGILGIASMGYLFWKKSTDRFWQTLLIFIVIYFGFFGMFAVKFMRYLQPLYPLIGLGIGGFLSEIDKKVKDKLIIKTLMVSVIGWQSVWAVAFLDIYNYLPTRVSSSQWISENLRWGSIIAIEHWDDGIPVPPYIQGFQQESLPLYDLRPIPGDINNELEDQNDQYPYKWVDIAEKLEKSDAVVIASNRLYAPLMRLDKNYPIAKRYYEKLFSGELGFRLAHTSWVRPGIGPWRIDDQMADESFHVYDHPKVMVFVKESKYTKEQLFGIIWNDD